MARQVKSSVNRSPLSIRVGREIRKARGRMGLSQERLAELADLSKNYIGNIERGEYEVTVSTLNRIAGALRLKISELLSDAGY